MIEIGANLVGIKNCIKTWEEFNQVLIVLHENNYKLFDNINYNRVIMDGKSYERTIALIKKISLINRK